MRALRLVRISNLTMFIYMLYKQENQYGDLLIDYSKKTVNDKEIAGAYEELLTELNLPEPGDTTRLNIFSEVKEVGRRKYHCKLNKYAVEIAKACAEGRFHDGEVLTFKLLIRRKPHLRSVLYNLLKRPSLLEEIKGLGRKDQSVTWISLKVFFDKKSIVAIYNSLVRILNYESKKEIVQLISEEEDPEKVLTKMRTWPEAFRESKTIQISSVSEDSISIKFSGRKQTNCIRFKKAVEDLTNQGFEIEKTEPRFVEEYQPLLLGPFKKYGYSDDPVETPFSLTTLDVCENMLIDMNFFKRGKINITKLRTVVPDIDILLDPQKSPDWPVFMSLAWETCNEIKRRHNLTEDAFVSTSELYQEMSKKISISFSNFIRAIDMLARYNKECISWHYITAYFIPQRFPVPRGKEAINIQAKPRNMPYLSFPGGS